MPKSSLASRRAAAARPPNPASRQAHAHSHVQAITMADDVGLPKSTLQKSIKDLVPKDMRIASEASDLLVQCCNQFVHLLSTQANDISEREKRSTITPEHVVKALEELEFGEQYIEAVKAGKQAGEQLSCLALPVYPHASGCAQVSGAKRPVLDS